MFFFIHKYFTLHIKICKDVFKSQTLRSLTRSTNIIIINQYLSKDRLVKPLP